MHPEKVPIAGKIRLFRAHRESLSSARASLLRLGARGVNSQRKEKHPTDRPYEPVLEFTFGPAGPTLRYTLYHSANPQPRRARRRCAVRVSPCRQNARDHRRDQMITFVRTADIHDGKLRQAFTWAAKVASYVNQKFPGSNLQVSRNIGGPINQVRWMSSYESLASFEKIMRQVESDDGYQALLAEVREQGALIGISIVDSLYETIA
jgi:hypothetical protein